jgi:hypothetical protein
MIEDYLDLRRCHVRLKSVPPHKRILLELRNVGGLPICIKRVLKIRGI